MRVRSHPPVHPAAPSTPHSPAPAKTSAASTKAPADVFQVQAAKVQLPRHRNPIIRTDTPDPGVIQVGNKYYLTATSGGGQGLPLMESTDLVHWHNTKTKLLPNLGKSAWIKGNVWAPEIHQLPNGTFAAYYCAEQKKNGLHAIGVSTAPSITGPWKDLGHPLKADPHMGLIDPTFITAQNGKSYVYWKYDGNSVTPHKPTMLWAQEVSSDGKRLEGKPHHLFANDVHSWEGPIVEAPELTHHNGYYYMFYSGNWYNTDKYAVGVARSRSPVGPFKKLGHPILQSSGAFKGPGHNSPLVTGPDGKTYMVYHAWEAGHVGKKPGRVLCMDEVTWVNGWPQVHHGKPSGS